MNPTLTRRGLLGLMGALPAAIAPRNAAGAAPRVRLVQHKGEKLSFYSGDRPLFEYRYATSRPKPYVHPLYAPNGVPVTIDSPPDHVHHRGLMLAWSDIKGFDFWGEVNPGPHGQIVHQRFEKLQQRPVPVAVAVNHWIADGKVLLIERRTIRAPAQSPDVVWLEWESELRPAKEAITLSAEKHPYDGLGIRFIRSMDGGQVLNAQRTNTIEKANGEEASWATYSGPLEDGGTCGVAIFDHPGNPRHPTPFFVMNKPFGYLSAAPTFRESLQLNPGTPIRLRYAVIAYLGAPQPDRLSGLFQEWSSRSRS